MSESTASSRAAVRQREESARGDTRVWEEGAHGPLYVWVCARCGQPASPTHPCNSALHVAPGEQANGDVVHSTALARSLEDAKAALDDIATKAESGITRAFSGPNTAAFEGIRQRAHEALHIPQIGKRVRCLIEHRGEQGTIVGWDDVLRLPLVQWDDLPGPPEAVEANEYEVLS